MTPYVGQPVSEDELRAFCRLVLAAWPGTVITVYCRQERAGANNPRAGG